MNTTSCLIAGLPNSGKSTYIGALWYNLQNRSENMKFKASDNLPDNIQHLNELSKLWIKAQKLDRTNAGTFDSVVLNVELKETNYSLSINVPDFLGETFLSIIDKQESEELNEWCNKTDTLFYMVHEVDAGHFNDDVDIKDADMDEQNDKISPLKSSDMPAATKNILILKYLFGKKKFKRVVFALTWWDEITENGSKSINPEVWLKNNSPALFNFIKHSCNDCKIIGISAQGFNYEKLNKKEIIKKTKDGKRAFVEIDNDIEYDLSLPLYILTSE